MAKNLDLGLPQKDPKSDRRKEIKLAGNTKKKESGATVDLNFKVNSEFKKEFKMWAAAHEITQKEVLETAFQLLKNSHI
jgi:hypothetical protein